MKIAVQFLQEVRGELEKVVWPKFDVFVELTVVTLVLIVAFALYLGFLDRLSVNVIKYVLRLYG